jgi:ABC-type uncharacterized transport system involved in gliding motility auxiliary subunit
MSSPTKSEKTSNTLTSGRIAAGAAILGAVVFVCVNLVSGQLLRSARIDLTEQHLYSLSQGTRTLLGDLKEPVRFRFFMSSGLTKQAPQLAAFAERVRTLLDAYVAAAKGNIILEVIDPRPFSEEEDRAVAFGMDGMPGAGGERLFFGLAATDTTTGRGTIRLFSPDRENFLEYDLTRLVSELGRRGKPVIALLDGLGLAGNPQMRMPEQVLLAQMKQFFDVKTLTGDVDKLPDGTRVLMVVHPQELSDRTLYTIDQWVLGGNAAMIFVDPLAENQPNPNPRGMPMPPPNPTSNLEGLFKAWGVKFDPTRAVGDMNLSLQTEREINGRPAAVQNPPWIALRGESLARDEAILAQLSAIIVTTAGYFESAKEGVSLRPLLRASGNAVTFEAMQAADRTGDPRRLLANATRSATQPVIAARLFGALDSAYPEGAPGEARPDPNKPGDAADKPKTETIKRSTKVLNVILFADADMLMDRNWVQQQAMFGQQMARAFANNGDFIINAVEAMAGGSALADLRGRGISWRPFELIQRMESDANDRFRAKEQELSQQLRETEQKLTQLPKAAEGASELLSPEQSKAIEGFRAQMLRIRSELRDVQFALRRDVDSLKNWVTALNVAAVPVTAAIIVLVFALRRPRRAPPVKAGSGTQDGGTQG